ncbi:MAG: zinc ribbon domain-containing protein [Desulfobacteraceae bacterium]|nr:zinc ribbon domain-containing protein [Desulfobacteraceae bacterium]MBC2754595.1 zinc ribbon domain-containing protein [Desulfobacteraceae bacterium]
MPIYEFYCKDCHTIYNFFSRSVNTKKVPGCPKCRNLKLTKQVSLFAVTGRAEENSMDDLPIDESKMEKAMEMMAKEAENINEDDPRQAAKLMRKLTDMTGVGLGQGMEEALQRMESGEDPEKIEAEMGDLMDGEEPFILPGKKGGGRLVKSQAPRKDETLYDL